MLTCPTCPYSSAPQVWEVRPWLSQPVRLSKCVAFLIWWSREPGRKWGISRTTNVFLINLTRWDGQAVHFRQELGRGVERGDQWLLNQTMEHRVPLVLSSIPLLPWDTQIHSAWMAPCPRRSGGAWFVRKGELQTQQLVSVPPLHWAENDVTLTSPIDRYVFVYLFRKGQRSSGRVGICN